MIECLPQNYNRATPARLLIGLHGGLGSGAILNTQSGLCTATYKENIITVLPNAAPGQGGTWNAGDCCDPALKNGINDARFISAVIDHYQSNFNIDPKAIFLTGLSNGAMEEYLVARRDPRVAGIFVVSGTDSAMSQPNPNHQIHFFRYHGASDTNIPPQGGLGGVLSYSKPSQKAISEEWAKINKCAGNTTTSHPGYTETVFNCTNGTEMLYRLVNNVPHQWGMPLPQDTTTAVVNFVKTHNRVSNLTTRNQPSVLFSSPPSPGPSTFPSILRTPTTPPLPSPVNTWQQPMPPQPGLNSHQPEQNLGLIGGFVGGGLFIAVLGFGMYRLNQWMRSRPGRNNDLEAAQNSNHANSGRHADQLASEIPSRVASLEMRASQTRGR